ncbi:MAG: hypothetical protein C3F10_10345 [Dehalococcoidia bacterium]|nr:MAG: hypothetical protein C3F10_10345 [Dehalococcoidia bacterium]
MQVPRFPVDAPQQRVLRAFAQLGFVVVRHREHISLMRERPGGGRDTLTIPNHPRISSGTLRAACSQGNIPRDAFIDAYERS